MEPLTLAVIKQHLEGRRFPAILDESDYAEIVTATLREINRYIPASRYVAFITLDGVQDYHLFDTDDSVTAGVGAGATEIRGVFYNLGGGFEVIGLVGAKDSILRLDTVPIGENKVIVELSIKMGLSEVNDAIEDNFYQWLEYYAADALANLYATTAGVNLLNFADSKDAMRYWQTKADRYYNKAISLMSGVSGSASR